MPPISLGFGKDKQKLYVGSLQAESVPHQGWGRTPPTNSLQWVPDEPKWGSFFGSQQLTPFIPLINPGIQMLGQVQYNSINLFAGTCCVPSALTMAEDAETEQERTLYPRSSSVVEQTHL